MYVYQSSVVLERTIGSQWRTDVDLSTMLVSAIYQSFTKAYLVLTNTANPGQTFYVDMSSIMMTYYTYENTLEQLFIDIGSSALPTVDQLPDSNIRIAKYSDGFRAKYKLSKTKIGVVLPENYPESEINDLEITRPSKLSTPINKLHESCLIDINGFIHETTTDGIRTFIYDGVKTLRKNRYNHFGILSFLDVCPIQKVKLTQPMISKINPSSTLSERVIITVPNDLENKSCILVLGGYMVFMQANVFWRLGLNELALNLNNLPYLERIIESDLYLDISHLDLIQTAPGVYNPVDVFSDEKIMNNLTARNTFLVILDTPLLLTNKVPIRTSSIPGYYTAYQEPELPMFINYGKLANYWKQYEHGYWSVKITDAFSRNYIISQEEYTHLASASDNLLPNNPYILSKGHLLEISSSQLAP